MDLSQLELHDASLLAVALDPVARTVIVKLAYYPSGDSPERVAGTLQFSGVTHFNQLSDLELLEQHAKFGNVSQGIFGESAGTSYIYLARGLISVTASSVEFTNDA
ncbi:hypothetical protein [Xanthomonas tesorieronis]|uniref:hypothetical protein n=1 Tax=Xanthomonas tesorieronis TaxID=3160839 RepID=UPI003512EA67